MTSRNFRVRLPQSIDEQLVQFCHTWKLTLSAGIRLAVVHLVQHPDEVIEQLAARVAPVADPRSPAQAQAWELELQRLEAFDMAAVVGDYMTQWEGGDGATVEHQAPPEASHTELV